MRVDRRKALGLLGLGAAAQAAPAAAHVARALGVTFQHGVASGDPSQDRVIIWTRITPESPHTEIAYGWSLIPLDRRAGGARKGTGVTGPDRDFTVKVDVGGLEAGRAYTFAFTAEGVTSPTGLTRTLPAGTTRDVVIATTSCALYPNGYFNAYQAIADLPRVDLVLALGDYLYEYGGPDSYGMDSPVAGERPHDPPHEILTLADYRRRHAQYKSDPGLQAAHAKAPWIVAWDDHETANDSFRDGAEDHNPDKGEGDWTARKAIALKAYYEWMPIRDPAAGQSLAEAAQRSFAIGDLASILMLETRLTARDKQLTYDADLPVKDGKPDIAALKAKLADPSRRILSAQQAAWMGAELAGAVKAGRPWQVIASGVVMGRLFLPDPESDFPPGALDTLDEAGRRRIRRWSPLAKAQMPYGLDMWDGYPRDRERVYDAIRGAGARAVVVSGDSHAFWANELSDAAGKRVAVEFGTTAISSPGGGDVLTFDIGAAFAKASPEVVFCEQKAKGFVLLTLSHDKLKAELMTVSTIQDRSFTTGVLKTFEAYPDGAGVSPLKAV